MAATSSTYLPPRKSSDYTVAWLCANPAIEYAAALKMLDKWHNPPTFHNASDSNQYWFGDLNRHNVVVASTPPNKTGKVSAQKLIAPLHQSFPNLKICLFVGIGGGVPCVPEPEDPYKDVRLGDVVIGWSENTGEPAVIQYDYVRRQSKDRADLLGHVDNPKDALLSGLNNIIARKKINAPTNFAEHLKRLEGMEEDFGHPGPGTDILFDPEYKHPEGKESCDECDSDRRVQRRQRSSDKLIFHLSTILSGDTLMEDATERDRLSRKYYNAKCFDMEAAPVTGGLQCLVFRGISDYADNHRSYKWHNYAAGRAAAFAREYLIGMRVQDIRDLPSGIPERYFTASQVSWSSSGSFQSRNDSQGQLLLEEGDTQEQMDRSPEGIGSTSTSSERANADFRNIYDRADKIFKTRHGPDSNTSQALATSISLFKQAQVLLVENNNKDPQLQLEVCFRLLILERETTFEKDTPLEQRMVHMKRAEIFGNEALSAAKTVGKAGVQAQVKLQIAFTQAREATIGESLQVGSEDQEVSLRKKKAALQSINSAWQGLKIANRKLYDDDVKLQETKKWWIRELS